MTTIELHQLIVRTILTAASRMEPQGFKAFFCGGIIANVIGNLPDDYWAEFRKIEPCDRPGCDCHLHTAESMIKALAALREDHRQHTTRTFSA